MSDPETKTLGELPPLSPQGLGQLAAALAGLKALESYPSLGPGAERTFGRFVLRSVLGQGRFGVVFLAEDPQAGRSVALKLPQPAVLMDPGLTERFRRDVEAAAHLDHPGIVPVLETGSVLTIAYIAMPYVEGPTLAGWLKGRGGASVEEAVGLVIALAEAVQHAHERGVLHCDLKPANVLLSERGEAGVERVGGLAPLGAYAPRVTDFGLARLLFQPDDTTRTHLAAGSPPYMAPEQAHGVRRDLTARCDVHALAAILYELLTGQLPYVGPSEADRVAQLIAEDVLPVPPRSVRRGLARDLEAIVLKGLEKSPGRRYESARALAEDLRRFQEGRPTQARPVGVVGRAVRLSRRRPLVALLVGACLTATVALIGLGARAVEDRRKLAEAARAAEMLELNALLDRVRQRRLERPRGWAEANLNDLRRLAAMGPAAGFQPALRTEAAAALAQPRLRQVGEVGVGRNAYVCAFSPDGGVLALGERYPVLKSNELRVWVVRVTGEELAELRYPVDLSWEQRQRDRRADGARSLAYSPDGRWLVLGTRGGRLVRWDLGQKAARAECWDAHQGAGADHTGDEVRSLVFNRDGSVLLSGCDAFRGSVRRWGVREGWKDLGGLKANLPVGGGPVRESCWVYCYEGGYALRLLDLRTGRLGLAAPAPSIARFCQSPEGGRLVAVTHAGKLNSWLLAPTDHGEQVPLLGAGGLSTWERAQDLSFSPCGRRVWVTSEAESRVEVWDALGRAPIAGARLGGGSARLAVQPGGGKVAVCVEGRTLLFELAEGPARRDLAAGGEVLEMALSADGERLGTCLAGLSLPEAPAERLAVVALYRRGAGGQGPVPYQRVWVTGVANRRVGLAPRESGLVMATTSSRGGRPGVQALDGRWVGAGEVTELEFGPDGQAWVGTEGGELLLWDGGRSARVVAALPPDVNRAGVTYTALRAGPGGVLAGRRDGLVEWYDGRGVRRGGWRVYTDQEVTSLALAPGGAEALVGGSKGAVARLGLPSGQVIRAGLVSHSDTVVGLGYLGGGVMLTASADHTVALWDEWGHLLLTLRESGPVMRAEVAAGGGQVYVLVKGEWGVRVWDLEALRGGLLGLGLAPGYSVEAAPRAPPAPPAPRRGCLLAEVSSFPTSGPVIVERRYDAGVKFDWGDGGPVPWVSPDGFSVRWTGRLRAPKAGAWEVQLESDDAATLWVDGREVLHQRRRGSRRPVSATVGLPAGPVSFRLDYEEHTGRARCRLLWRPAGGGGKFEVVPRSAFTVD